MPPAHIDPAERKQSQAGVFSICAQVCRLRSLGQPWRMKQMPMNTRSNSNAAWAKGDGAAGTNSSTTVMSMGVTGLAES